MTPFMTIIKSINIPVTLTLTTIWSIHIPVTLLMRGLDHFCRCPIVSSHGIAQLEIGWINIAIVKQSQTELWWLEKAGIVLWMHPANERRRYIVTSSLICWVHTQNYPWKGHQASLSSNGISLIHWLMINKKKLCIALPDVTKFRNWTDEWFFIWSLTHGSSWSGLIKAGPV